MHHDYEFLVMYQQRLEEMRKTRRVSSVSRRARQRQAHLRSSIRSFFVKYVSERVGARLRAIRSGKRLQPCADCL